MANAARLDRPGEAAGHVLLPHELVEPLRSVAAGDYLIGGRFSHAVLRHGGGRSDADERPSAQRDDCLWLLRLGPDQVHRSPSQGPLIGIRAALFCTPPVHQGQRLLHFAAWHPP